MDSYNRGYDAGIMDGGASDPDGLGVEGSRIGNAVVKLQDSSESTQAAGFYAIAYDIQDSSITGLDADATIGA